MSYVNADEVLPEDLIEKFKNMLMAKFYISRAGVRKQWAGVKRTVLKTGLQSETRR